MHHTVMIDGKNKFTKIKILLTGHIARDKRYDRLKWRCLINEM